MAENGRYFDLLATLVASGRSIRDASTEAGCSETTGYRLSAGQAFRTKVSELRSQAVGQAVGKLSDAATQATDKLVALLDCGNHSVELRAATAILDQFSKLSETVELRVRLEKLEKALEARTLCDVN